MNGIVATVFCCLMLVATAAGAEPHVARQLYERGDMLRAAELARAAGEADGFTLAARATLVDALYLAPAKDEAALLEQSADDARAALAEDPDHVEAMVQLALALGHIARLTDPVSAHLAGYAEEGRAVLERALALAPDDAWAKGLLGMWHMQVVHRATAPVAAALYGASAETGAELCAAAVAALPAALSLRYGCALSLYELDPERNAAEALSAIKEVTRMPPKDAAEALVRADARAWLARSG